jgi:hypothetical protein
VQRTGPITLIFGSGALGVAAASSFLVQQYRDAAWAALLVMAAVWLRALDPLPHGARGLARIAKGIVVVALAAGVVLLAFALGARNVVVPKPAPAVSNVTAAAHFERIADLRASAIGANP